jgi:hypothetical protein
MVANLSGKEAAPADAAQKVKTAAPAGLDHKYSIDKIVGSIKAQEDTIAELGKRVRGAAAGAGEVSRLTGRELPQFSL